MSAHWLRRWCDLRDADVIDGIRAEIEDLRIELACCNADDLVSLNGFFAPSVQSLIKHLDSIDTEMKAQLGRNA